MLTSLCFAVGLVRQFHPADGKQGLQGFGQILVGAIDDVLDRFVFAVDLHADPVVLTVDQDSGGLAGVFLGVFVRRPGHRIRPRRGVQHEGSEQRQENSTSRHGGFSWAWAEKRSGRGGRMPTRRRLRYCYFSRGLACRQHWRLPDRRSPTAETVAANCHAGQQAGSRLSAERVAAAAETAPTRPRSSEWGDRGKTNRSHA